MYFVENVDIKVDITKLLEHLVELHFDRDYDIICKILKIERDLNYNKDEESTYKYNKQYGMIFCKEDTAIQVRIHIDEETRNALNTILIASSDIINEKNMIDIIIDKWLKKVGVTGKIEDCDTIQFNKDNNTYTQLRVGKKIWDKLLLSCKNKNISVKEGFKISLFNYLQNLEIN